MYVCKHTLSLIKNSTQGLTIKVIKFNNLICLLTVRLQKEHAEWGRMQENWAVETPRRDISAPACRNCKSRAQT